VTADLQPSSVLSDATIRELIDSGRIKIEPFDPSMVQPASVDIRLGNSFRVFHNHRIQSIDLADPPRDLTEHVEIGEDGEFVIHPGEFVLGRTAEFVELPDDVVSRIEGKALALDTEIPTPDGWTTMGEIAVGDQVFGPGGWPRRVVAATDVMHRRPCFELVFSDGTSVVADAGHQWRVEDRHRPKARVMTTQELIEAGLKSGRSDYRFRIPESEPVRYSSKDLPVDPYVFGAWIGDGTSTCANITSYDEPVLREIELAGYSVRQVGGKRLFHIGGAPRARDAETGRFAPNGSLHSILRREGLLGAKNVPDAYLQADVDQRWALLEGLMDTDGYVDKWGRCELTTVKRPLADQYMELIASLGFRPKLSVKTATLNGKVCGLKYDATFTPDRRVFRLPRKLARQERDGFMNYGRSIVSIRQVASVPVRCIEVGSPDGLYLVTRRFIPTHNSSIGRLGLVVHATAGFVDPGFRGTLTLEITNFNSVPIVLRPGLPIAQLSFMALDRPAEKPYGHPDLGSHYYGQIEATESRYGSTD
jgi:deoxycytidine triphosphate deaminase